mmetsp:Transcript_6502/g.14226  ORF Transcript_6502/g.14226 Transcript_6502/m.14226 type:complete len:135 (+) Transcript_6502:122-526(+)
MLASLAGRWVTSNSEDDKEDLVIIAADGIVKFAGAPDDASLKLEESPASPNFVLREVSEDSSEETAVVAKVVLEEGDDGTRVLKLVGDDGTTEEWHAIVVSPKAADAGKVVTRKKGGVARVWTKEGQAGAEGDS